MGLDPYIHEEFQELEDLFSGIEDCTKSKQTAVQGLDPDELDITTPSL